MCRPCFVASLSTCRPKARWPLPILIQRTAASTRTAPAATIRALRASRSGSGWKRRGSRTCCWKPPPRSGKRNEPIPSSWPRRGGLEEQAFRCIRRGSGVGLADGALVLGELAFQKEAHGFLGGGRLLHQVDLHARAPQGLPGASAHAPAEDHGAVLEQGDEAAVIVMPVSRGEE